MTTIISPSGQKNNEFATWDLTKKYRAGDLVVYLSKIYEANDTVSENTSFTIGTTGATWALAVDYAAGAVTPAGADSQIQFNDNGILGATDRLAFILDTDTLDVFNLAVTNNVNSSLIPGSPGTFDIGDPTMTWKDIWAESANVDHISLKGFTEAVTTPAFNATFAPDVSLSSIVKFTATANFTFNGFTTPVAGQSATIIVTQDATGSRLMTSTMKFSGGVKTLSTAAGAIDIISVFYDGSAYYASLTTAYA